MRTIVIALCVLGSQASFAQDAEPADIPQANVAAVLESLRADLSAQFGEQRGWTVVASSEHGLPVQWFFTPEGHPAHPAVVKRTALESDGVGRIDLAALCQAEEAACAQLLDDFRQQHELAQAAALPERDPLFSTPALVGAGEPSAQGLLPRAEERRPRPNSTKVVRVRALRVP